MDNLAENLGFYFVVYQKNPDKNFVKCWIDGGDAEYIDYSEFISWVNLSKNLTLIKNIKESLDQSSIFIWDIENERVRRLKTSKKDSYLSENIFKDFNLAQKGLFINQESSLNTFYNSNVNFLKDSIKIKI